MDKPFLGALFCFALCFFYSVGSLALNKMVNAMNMNYLISFKTQTETETHTQINWAPLFQ